jgi:uncharacterized membrane protein YgdD (TMEM256/DUF423 family)
MSQPFDTSKLRTASMLGFLAVALGAMGAHGLKTAWEAKEGIVEAAKLLEIWKTASLYHIVHALVLLVMAYAFPKADEGRWIWRCFVSGLFIFSGSLYLLCLTGTKWLGAITPIGGLLLMTGWLLLAVSAGARKKE